LKIPERKKKLSCPKRKQEIHSKALLKVFLYALTINNSEKITAN